MLRILFIIVVCFISMSNAISLRGHFGKEREEYMRRTVKAFKKAWKSYKDYAWGMDTVNPNTKSGYNWYSESLLMTPIDAFSTMCIMGLQEEKSEARKLILGTLSFDKNIEVQQFEITIRILGGLLSSYQLDGDPKFLELAEDLGKRLIKVFDSPTGMPYRNVNLRTGAVSSAHSNPAEIGTSLLEFGMLSKFTGNSTYYEKSKKAVVTLYRLRDPVTNLLGSGIDVTTGRWTDTESSIGAGMDSFFEYLLKGWKLFGDYDLKEMWEVTSRAIDEYLKYESKIGNWYAHVDMRSGTVIKTEFGALDCFYAGCLALAGQIKEAARLQNSIFKMWTLHEIEPEMLNFKTMAVVNPSYLLRPEAIESAFYLWHFTKDKKYYEMGKIMFSAIEKYCQTEDSYIYLDDVISKKKGNGYLESFFFAETLKYSYLIFAPDEFINLDTVVFNTEAQPFLKT